METSPVDWNQPAPLHGGRFLNLKGNRVGSFAHMLHTGTGRSLFVPQSAVPSLLRLPNVLAHPSRLDGRREHINPDLPLGKVVRSDQDSKDGDHAHSCPFCVEDTHGEPLPYGLAIMLLESDCLAFFGESALSRHGGVPHQTQRHEPAPDESRPASEPGATGNET